MSSWRPHPIHLHLFSIWHEEVLNTRFFFGIKKIFFKECHMPCQIGTFNGDMSTWENGDVVELENAPSVSPVKLWAMKTTC